VKAPLELHRLTNQGIAAIDPRFLAGDPPRLPDDPELATRLPGHPELQADLSLDVPEGPLGPEHDVSVALQLHRQLPLRRGVAVDARMWAWLGARHLADVLRRRWATEERPAHTIRFVGRLTEQGLARLWWAAELTCETGNARPRPHDRAVSALLASQYRTDRLLSMPLLRHPPAMLGMLDALGGDLRSQVTNELCRRLGLVATTYAVVAMTRPEVAALAIELHAQIVRELRVSDPPDGPGLGG